MSSALQYIGYATKNIVRFARYKQNFRTVLDNTRPTMDAKDRDMMSISFDEAMSNHGSVLSALFPLYETIAQGYLKHSIEPNMRPAIDYYMVNPFHYKKKADFLPILFKGMKTYDTNHLIMMWKLMIPMLNNNDSRFVDMLEKISLAPEISYDGILDAYGSSPRAFDKTKLRSTSVIYFIHSFLINTIIESDMDFDDTMNIVEKFMESTTTGKILRLATMNCMIPVSNMNTIIHNKDIDMLTSCMVDYIHESLTGDGITWMHDHYRPQDVDVAEMANMYHHTTHESSIQVWKESYDWKSERYRNRHRGEKQLRTFHKQLIKAVNTYDESAMNAISLLIRIANYEIHANHEAGIVAMDDEFVHSDTFSSMVSDGMPINVIAESGFSWNAF